MALATKIAMACVLVVVVGSTADAVTLRYARWIPGVLTATATQSAPMVLEATGVAATAAVTLELDALLTAPFSRPLRDDGLFGDRVAGDKVFSIQIPSAEMRGWNQTLGGVAGRRRQLTIGTLKTFSSSGELLGIVSINVPVLSDAIPAVPVEKIGHALQFTPHVVNVPMPLAQFDTTQDAAVTSLFYQYFKDSFDFLSIVYDGSRFQNRHFIRTQNSIAGIGFSLFSLSSQWGSAGRLQGFTVFPNGGLFNTTTACSDGYLHELGHRWINGLQGGMHDPFGFHWPLSDIAGGIMGFSAHTATGNGEGFAMSGAASVEGNTMEFKRFVSCPGYADLELYLMGLLDSSQVINHLVAADQNQFMVNGSIQGPFNSVTIQDVIASNGARVPSAGQAQKSFRTATILVTPDTFASRDVMDYYENEALYAEAAFDFATGKLGQLRGEVDTETISLALPGVKVHRIRNAASLASGPVAPGEIIRIDGTLLALDDLTAVLQPGRQAPTVLGQTRVLMNGQAIPLLQVRPDQITAIVPSSLQVRGNAPAVFQVERDTGLLTFRSNVFPMPIAQVSPAAFIVDGLGMGMAEVYGPHGDLITTENLAQPGSQVIAIVNGMGPLTTSLPDGSLVPTRGTPPALANPVEVFVEGAQATVIAAQAIPGDVANKAAIRFVVPNGVAGDSARRQPQFHVVVAKRASQDGALTGVFVP
jgi:uncharacterized protein (TIGR03437 family)